MTPSTVRPTRRSPLDGLAAISAPDLSIAEVGPLDKTVAHGIGDAELAGRVVEAGPVATWHLSEGQAIVVGPPDAATDRAGVAARARTTVDVSSGWTVLRVSGAGARALLASACPADLSERAVADRVIVQAMLANVRVVLARTDVDGLPGFTLLVARDEARYLWDALSDLAMDAHGVDR